MKPVKAGAEAQVDDATIRERGLSALDVERWLCSRKATVRFSEAGVEVVTAMGERAESKLLTWAVWDIIKAGGNAVGEGKVRG